MITAIMSMIFLTFGVYTHYRIFSSEYRLSTWQEGLKIYAPAVMIIAIILFIIYGIIALFTGVNVPVPSVPEFEMPAANTVTNTIMNAYNNAAKNISEATNTITQNLSNATNKITTNIANTTNKVANKMANNVSKTLNQPSNQPLNNKSKIASRSFVETF
jgi:esterase/lipase